MIKNEEVFPLLVNLSRERPMEVTMGITHLDDSIFHISPQKDILLTIKTSDTFAKSGDKPALFRLYSS